MNIHILLHMSYSERQLHAVNSTHFFRREKNHQQQQEENNKKANMLETLRESAQITNKKIL